LGVIDSEIGGRAGTVVGAGIGALVGVAIGTDDEVLHQDYCGRGRDYDKRRYAAYRNHHREYRVAMMMDTVVIPTGIIAISIITTSIVINSNLWFEFTHRVR
jgi:hypothetical protein